MKKLLTIIMLAVSAIAIPGCDWNESAIVSTANSAGNIAMLTWFSIDDPDQNVKDVLKDVVTMVTTATVNVAEGQTYLDSILPSVQELALKQEKLTDYQKTLINAGSVIILNGIDTYLATNEKVKTNAALLSKVVGAFGKGCLMVLNMGENSPEIQRTKAVYATRNLQCRDGKFIPKGN